MRGSGGAGRAAGRGMLMLLRFGLLGGASFALTMGVTAALHELVGLAEEAAAAVALCCALLFNFLACRFVVFDGARGPLVGQIVAFSASSLVFRGSEYATFLALHTWVGLPYLPALGLVLVCGFLVKFVYYRWMFAVIRTPAP